MSRTSKKRRSVKTVSPETEKKIKTLGKIAKIAGYTGAVILTGIAIFWLTIPGGWIVSIGFFIAATLIAIETKRSIKV